jgi:hypothetical protein
MTTPASQSPQSQAIDVANGLLSISQQVLSIYGQLKELAAEWTDENVANTLSQLNTVAVNLDGSLATVNDTNITTTHPINPVQYPTLTRPVSVLQLTQAKTILDGLIAYIEGGAVTTQPGARAILHAVTGGN